MATMQEVWRAASDRVSQVVTTPTFFRALGAAVPVAWEKGVFVVGLSAENGQHAGVLATNDYRLKIEQALRQVSGETGLTFRVIEGTTPADWTAARTRDEIGLARAAQQMERQSAPVSTETWDGLADALARQWQSAELRTLASGKGRFLAAALATLAEGASRVQNEADERALSRLIERVAGYVAIDAAVVATLLFERQARP